MRAILAARIPCLVIHGRDDIIAAPKYGQRLAARLHCPFLLLSGAHFVFRESAPLVNGIIRSLLQEDTPLSQALKRSAGLETPRYLPSMEQLTNNIRAWMTRASATAGLHHRAGLSGLVKQQENAVGPQGHHKTNGTTPATELMQRKGCLLQG